jgi:hypothetical protein
MRILNSSNLIVKPISICMESGGLVHVATMHFEGPVMWWLQSTNHHIHLASWKELCSWIHDRFGHDQHESLIRQLFHIKQVGTVLEYIDKFSELVDPTDLDTAYTLTLL